jgi:plastocyanin
MALGAVIAISLIISAIATACGGLTTTDIVRTSEAENKVQNATATAAAVETQIAKGVQPVAGEADVTGGQAGLAGALRATAAAEATATVLAGGVVTQNTPTPTPSAVDVLDPPPGDPLTGNATVRIMPRGEMDPLILKIKVGTTVTWENTERANHSTVSDPGQAEQWNSGQMARRIGDTENRKFTYTFTKPGRYVYRSDVPTDPALPAVVFVVP